MTAARVHAATKSMTALTVDERPDIVARWRGGGHHRHLQGGKADHLADLPGPVQGSGSRCSLWQVAFCCGVVSCLPMPSWRCSASCSNEPAPSGDRLSRHCWPSCRTPSHPMDVVRTAISHSRCRGPDEDDAAANRAKAMRMMAVLDDRRRRHGADAGRSRSHRTAAWLAELPAHVPGRYRNGVRGRHPHAEHGFNASTLPLGW